MSYIGTSTVWSMVPVSCHCHGVDIGGIQYALVPDGGTGDGGAGAGGAGTGDGVAVIVTLTAAERVDAPRLSVATAVSAIVPVLELVHVTCHGALVVDPMSVEPA